MPTNNDIPHPDFFDFKLYQFEDKQRQKSNTTASIAIVSQALSSENRAFLHKILSAVQLDLNQGIDLYEKQVLYKDLSQELSYKTCLVFGYQPKEIGLHIQAKAYKIVPFKGIKLLFSHDLQAISEDVQKKKMLWQQLQLLFQKNAS